MFAPTFQQKISKYKIFVVVIAINRGHVAVAIVAEPRGIVNLSGRLALGAGTLRRAKKVRIRIEWDNVSLV